MARTAHAAVLAKESRAVSLYGEGGSYEEISEQLGYANRGSAWKAVDRGLRAQRDLRADDYLQTQITRYEAVLAMWWDRATAGHNAKAANVVLRALERLDRVLRLTEGEHTVSQESIVVSADPAAYSRQLQHVVEERDRQAGPAR